MLQQTQVDRVLPKLTPSGSTSYPSMERAGRGAGAGRHPNVVSARLQHPAEAAAVDRARSRCANYGGRLPSDEATLLSFKGIGAYTAGAIRSFAFRERAAILDTNVARVLFRVFVAKGDPKSHAMKRHLWTLSETLMPHAHVFDFNQALMDFGAMICVARNPKCLVCPMAEELPRLIRSTPIR